MTLQWWTLPVTIETRRAGKYLTIDSAEKAAEYMLAEWPGNQTGKLFDRAKQALIDAHDRKISADEAVGVLGCSGRSGNTLL
ncbi:DUF982 domain-containing protein (plasmid) [Rhizobium sp. CB3060]|uniref:DUF982 domain-containing protein n=1 Tax=Rhizobium sp. CB3060 TaxID=3138255 RepID=UPI0021A8F904|nr:DUF982 domain-containing protein [Rhizobium tropici]UWU25760.1 DUF982 domain-containing protein [Rhizobium tropici]